MERFRNTISELVENQRQKHADSLERDRQKRVGKHPHNPGCAKSKDIEMFDAEYTDGGPHPMFKIFLLASYSTRCQECGAEDHSHNLNKGKI